MKKLLRNLMTVVMLFAFGANASAQEAELIQEGVAKCKWYVFYVGESDLDFGVAFKRYSDGTIIFPGFVNGNGDLTATLGELDEYGCYIASFEDAEGVGYNGTFSFADFSWWEFDVYHFAEPVDITVDQMSCLFLDGTSYYDPNGNYFVFDYISAVEDEEEYMLIVYFDEPYEGTTTDIKAVSQERSNGVYNLAGQRMKNLQKGAINIVDGKKVLVK